jgi:DNA-binding XRE family transcriptional regulator
VLRHKAQLNRRHVAKLAGVSHRYLKAVERGRIDASAAWLGHVADVLSLQIALRGWREKCKTEGA